MPKTRILVPLNDIDDNPWQPRQQMDPEGLQGLADNIDQLGLLQVPLGREAPDSRIQTAFGHRRVAACRLNEELGRGEPHIEMDITELTDEEMALLALTENQERQQLSQVEVVRAHQKAIEETKLTVQALADQLGINRATLANNLRVLELPDFILDYVTNGDLGLTIAREFLVLQNHDHVHTKDMKRVIERITGTWGRMGAPDWSRRHVRQLISSTVSGNETDFRPIGPQAPYAYAGETRQATFDIEMFAAERPDTIHTIPASDSEGGHYQLSRTWTCDVKGWRSWQSRATREANKEAEAQGKPNPNGTSREPTKNQELQNLMAKDPVFKKISVSRETAGPSRPVNDEEREALGTRAELKEVSRYGNTFYKTLQKANIEDVNDWTRQEGGNIPPFFPDLDECKTCTIGAAYAKSRESYENQKPFLACFNKDHYNQKLQLGLAAYKENVSAHQKGIDRQDARAITIIKDGLTAMPDDTCQTLAMALVSAQATLEWYHPLGAPHDDFSYESIPVAKARDLLNGHSTGGNWRGAYRTHLKPEVLQDLTPENIRELIAALTSYHLRDAGLIDTVSQETPTVAPDTTAEN